VKASEPPIVGRALLWLFLPEREMESIPGDLQEEFTRMVHSSAGLARARRWHLRQVIASLGPMLSMDIRCGEAVILPLLVFFAFVMPIWVLDALRTFVLSSVPLKADSIPSTQFLAAVLAIGFSVTAAMALLAAGQAPRDLLRTSCRGVMVAVCLGPASCALSNANHPAWFVFFLVLFGPLGVLAGSGMRSLLGVRAEDTAR
jgi:hypothetical protein